MAQAQLDVLKQQQKSTLEKLADTIIQRVDTCYNVKPKQMEAIKNFHIPYKFYYKICNNYFLVVRCNLRPSCMFFFARTKVAQGPKRFPAIMLMNQVRYKNILQIFFGIIIIKNLFKVMFRVRNYKKFNVLLIFVVYYRL